jgi:hypothetical protein
MRIFSSAEYCSISRSDGGFRLMESLASPLVDGYGRANKSSLPQPSQSISEAGISSRGKFPIQIR